MDKTSNQQQEKWENTHRIIETEQHTTELLSHWENQ